MKQVQTRTLLLGACGIAGLGLWIDYLVGHNAFARSGAVLVIFGVVMVAQAIRTADAWNARNEARFEKLEAAYLDAGDTADQTKPVQVFSRLADIYSDMRQSRLEREMTLLNWELVIVCSGTLIWGFGDLLTLALWGPAHVR